MQCPACRHDIPGEARFCPNCGEPLASARAGALSPAFGSPQAYTPRYLAEKILTTRGALEGERKHVTVLFADVSGFTRFSESHDPEDVHRVMTQAFELMLAEVHRYEGTVNQFLGDGIMALFGAPVAHEDHVLRAVQAALGIRRALERFRDELGARENIGFEMRQGLHTGPVVVGSIGTDLRMDYTAVGDTTNVAARLVQISDPGRIVISEAVYRLAEGYFYTRPLGALSLKGKADPVRAWEVVSARQVRTRLEMRAERGLSAFVGREQELDGLVALFGEARQGRGQIGLLSGDPGIGKSRLLLELRNRLGEEATWLEGHSSATGRAVAFHPIIDLLKRNFRIEEGDREDAVARKIERAVLLIGEDLRGTLPYLRLLLSLDPGDPALARADPKQHRAGLVDAVRRLIVRAAEIRPQVLVMEDLHWMDQATEELLLAIAPVIAASKVLCLLTTRPAHPHPFGRLPNVAAFTLGALPDDQAAGIAHAVLAAERLPAELADLVVRGAEGNPFFVEEMIQSLRDSGVLRASGERYVLAKALHEIVVPGTIHDLIASRIDRLPESAKRTLQTAAVIGRRFSARLLEETVGGDERGSVASDVARLAQHGFVQESRAAPEAEYAFKHALTQDVAYDGLLQQRRRVLHGQVADAIERRYRELPEEQYPVLAYHYGRSENPGKAIEYLIRAGERALKLYANAEAKLHFGEALQRLEREPDSPQRAGRQIDVTLRLCGVSDTSEEFSRDLEWLARALAQARAIGDRRRESQTLYWTGRTYYTIGRTTLGAEPAEQALAIADELGDEKLGALPINLLGRLYFLSDFKKACPILERSLRLIDPSNRVDIALTQGGLGWSLAMVGDFERAFDAAERGLAIAQEIGHVPTLAGCQMYRACAHASRGDWPVAIPGMRDALALAEKVGDHFRIYLTTGFLGGYHVMQGVHGTGVELLERMIGMADRIGTRLGLHNAYLYLAESCLRRGLADQAVAHARRALGMAIESQQRWSEGWGRRVLGEALARQAASEPGEAERELREAVRILETLGTLPDLARAQLAYGRLRLERGDPATGEPAVARACAMFQSMGMAWDLAQAE